MTLLQGARIQHVALSVTDLDAALAFYVDQLGLSLAPRPDFGFPGAWLALGRSHQIHLFELPGDEVPARRDHFALEVDDLDAVLAELDAAGVAYRRSAHVPGAGHQAVVRDPSGNRIELNQPES